MARRDRGLKLGLAAVVAGVLALFPIPAQAAGTSELFGTVTLGWALDGTSVLASPGEVRVTYGSKSSPTAPAVWQTQESVVTTADGRYNVPELGTGLHALRFEYVGPSTTRYENVVVDDGGSGIVLTGGPRTVDVNLARYITVAGHVEVGTTGRSAVAGEVVVAFRSTRSGPAEFVTSTDAVGDYSIEVIQNDWFIDFSHSSEPQRYPAAAASTRYGPGFWSYKGTSITSSNQGVTDFDQMLLPATGVRGQMGGPGFPQAGIEVTVDRYDATTLQFLDSTTVVSQPDGYWVIETGPGVAYVYFEDPLHRLGSGAFRYTSFYDIPDELGIALGQLADIGSTYLYPGATLTGTVNGGGVTLPDLAAGFVRVGVEYHDFNDGWVDAGWSFQVEPDGSFTIDDLAAGYHVYRFRAVYDGPRGYAEVVSPTMNPPSGARVTWDAVLPVPQVLDLTVYRFWSEQNQSHFYTADEAERDFVIASYSDAEWLYEGAAYSALSMPVGGAVPLYRFWSERYRGHFYTVSESERDFVIAAYTDDEWQYEGVAYYVIPVDLDVPGSQAVARFWSARSGHHFYTADAGEADAVKTRYPPDVWAFEGDAFRVFPVPAAAGASVQESPETPVLVRPILEGAVPLA